MPPERYLLRVLPSDELNAYACGGHLVVVTSFAVAELTRRELAGVLAHELSHHLGMHTVALTIRHWLSLPVVLLARIGFFLQNVATAATEAFAAESRGLTTVGRVVAALLNVLSLPFVAALYASDVLGNLVGHRSELQADRRAVRMGYGRELSARPPSGDQPRRRPTAGRLARPPRRLPPAGADPRRPHRRHAPPPRPLTRPFGKERRWHVGTRSERGAVDSTPGDYPFAHRVRVRFAETDLMGIVHHSRYFPYLEEARVAYLRPPRPPVPRAGRPAGLNAAVLEACAALPPAAALRRRGRRPPASWPRRRARRSRWPTC